MANYRIETIPVVPGQRTRITLGYAEVVSHLGLAGQARDIVLFRGTHSALVQIYDEGGAPVSFPILAGEAGIYQDGTSFYAHRVVRVAEDLPDCVCPTVSADTPLGHEHWACLRCLEEEAAHE